MKSCLTVALLAWLVSGCVFGMNSDTFAPARTAAGINAEVTTRAGRLVGELIEVRNDAILVLAIEGAEKNGAGAQIPPRVLRLVPFASIVRARFVQLGSVTLQEGRPPSERVRERLRLLSRYPHGVSPSIEKELLKAYGQTGLAGAER